MSLDPKAIIDLLKAIRDSDDSERDLKHVAKLLSTQNDAAGTAEMLSRLTTLYGELLLPDDRTFTTMGVELDASIDQSFSELGRSDVNASVELGERRSSGSVFSERYSIGKEVARGGVGVINQAFEKPLRRHLVVKRLIDAQSVSGYVVDKFIEEAQITAQLEHPNIVPVHDLGRTDTGELYFSMKYVSGESLKDIIKRLKKGCDDTAKTFGRVKMLNIFQSVCMAMAFAHDRGIIHRDIKPANVMVGAFGETLVLDWGVAKVLNSENDDEGIGEGSVSTSRGDSQEQTQMGLITGTPAYMAPEQAAGRIDRLDQRTDIFALGVLLFEMLTFTSPFRKSTQRETLKAVIVEKPPGFDTIENIVPVPLALQRICLRCLEKRPKARYQTVDEILDELLGYLDGVEDVDRRQRMSKEQLEIGLEAVRQFESINDRLSQVEEAYNTANWEIPTYAAADQRRKVWSYAARASALRIQAEKSFANATSALSEAVSFDEANADAADELARLYWGRLKTVENQRDPSAAIFYRDAVERYDRGLFTERLKAEGELNVEASPSDVNVSISQLMEVDLRYTALPSTPLGRTPILNHRLREGNWVVNLSKPGYADVVYPIRVKRGEVTTVRCELLRPEQIGEHYLYVPFGACIVGGDPFCPSAVERRLVEVPGFLIARYPVTCAEYLSFLRALDTTNPHEAQRRAPRLYSGGGFLWQRNAQRVFDLPTDSSRGFVWGPHFPVVGISFEDAIAFTQWYSQTTGTSVRLPTENEWEKAARGPDERLYPWGDYFDALFCKTADSRQGSSMLENVGSFPYDLSPYGAYDMAGLVSEYCDTDFSATDGRKVIRGGNYLSQGPNESRATFRAAAHPTIPSLRQGFRLVRDIS